MFASLRKAANLLFDRTLSGVVIRALLLTILLFAVLFVAVEYGVQHLPTLGAPWVNAILDFLAPVLLILLIFFLGAPVAALFATFFLEDVARAVEARYYPADPRASGASFGTTLFAGLRLATMVILVDLALLPVDISVPGIAEVATILVNGWLLGREYFELVALRHMSRSAADALRRRHWGGVFWAGVIISLLTVVPLVNLMAPLFGAAFMVHMFKRYTHEERPV
ncbi:MAG: EI24 domain-containing protein [Alphaproteobacteria bacterium]|nr:EI24 domain-containing protein [Alphaproteobacteria bacterium]MDE1986892.1 EI24 domain-containing protein [Alphaproteobacteria bacterium]MDE2266703.1 EI24 domain-containing protein [Alphaproteobacteria bacterium]